MPELNSNNLEERGKEDRDALFKLITEEIKDLTEADKLLGWTPWVLLATLISMAWLIVQDVWEASPSVASVHAVFLAVSLVILLVLAVRAILTTDEAGRGPFTLLRTNITALQAFVTTLWAGTIAVACLTLQVIEGRYVLIIAGVVFSLQTLIFFATVFMRAFRIPTPSSRGFVSIIFGCILSIFYIVTLITVLKANVIATARVSDIRVGGLVALGAYVLVLLSRGGAGRATVKKTLVELRRDLMLGTLPVDEVQHRTREALEGLWLSDIVREDVRALLKFISDVRSIYDDAFRKIEALKASVPISSPSDAHPSDIEKVAISNTLDVLETHAERAQGIAQKYFARLQHVRIRLRVASRIVKSASSDEAKLMAEIKLAQASADTDLEKFVSEFHEIQSAWNLWYPTESRQYEPFNISAKDVNKRK